MHIGFSTGTLYKTHSMMQTIQILADLGCTAIEVSLIKQERMNDLDVDALKEALQSFSYISIHAPAKISEHDNELIAFIEDLCEQLPVRAVVLHPDNIEDFSVFEKSSAPWIIENMDPEKRKGGDVAFFESLSWSKGFCLDVNHALRFDGSLQLLDAIGSAMGSAITQIHISGFDENPHVKLYDKPYAQELLAAAKAYDVPLIIESVFHDGDLEELKKEFAFISSRSSSVHRTS